MDFFDQFMKYLEDDTLREELLGILTTDGKFSEDKMITGHWSDDGYIVFSVFEIEEWEMIKEMSTIIKKSVEDIIKDLGPEEVLQLHIRPDQGHLN